MVVTARKREGEKNGTRGATAVLHPGADRTFASAAQARAGTCRKENDTTLPPFRPCRNPGSALNQVFTLSFNATWYVSLNPHVSSKMRASSLCCWCVRNWTHRGTKVKDGRNCTGCFTGGMPLLVCLEPLARDQPIRTHRVGHTGRLRPCWL